MAKKSSPVGNHADDGDAFDSQSSSGFSVPQPSANAPNDFGLSLAGLVQTALGASAGSNAGGFQSDLIFLGSDSFAKGGPPGGGGGGSGGGGGGGTPSYVSGAPGHYNIEIVFTGTWTQPFIDDFKAAADILSTYIQGDIPDVLYRGKVIDDLSITAELTNIDGAGGILGQAGPTAVRTGSYLPATASMQFDIADATNYQNQALFDDIVLHEMMHSLGFGSIWSYKGLLAGAGTSNPLFTGAQAIAAYNAAAAGVPVEQDGGSGTRDSHWDEQTFGSELMTGYIGSAEQPTHDYLSYMTVASLGDLGYALGVDASTFVAPSWIT